VQIRNFIVADYGSIDQLGRPMMAGIFSSWIIDQVPFATNIALLFEVDEMVAPTMTGVLLTRGPFQQAVAPIPVELARGQDVDGVSGILLWPLTFSFIGAGAVVFELRLGDDTVYIRRMPVMLNKG
jgi:hypothetical protein